MDETFPTTSALPSDDGPSEVQTVERTIEIDADLQAVWLALTDPDAQADWLGEGAGFELRPGAGGRVVEQDGSARDLLVTEVEAPSRLTWHWWHDDGPLTTVEITTTRTDTGTLVRVVETLDPQ